MLRLINRGVLAKKAPWKSEEENQAKLYLRYFSNKQPKLTNSKRLLSEICPPPPKPPPKKMGMISKLMLSTVLVGGATLGYAKYDDNFRNDLAEYAPFTDTLIKYIFFEQSPLDALSESYNSLKDTVVSSVTFSETKDIPSAIPKPKEYKVGDVKPEVREEGIEDLERKICESATEAVNAYNRATYNLKKYNQEIAYVIDEAVDKIKPDVWDNIKEKSRYKQDCIKSAESKAEEASKVINELKCLLSKPSYKASEATKEIVRANLAKVQEDIANAKKTLENEKKLGSVTEKYWEKVEAARKHFSHELETLFPTIDLGSKQVHINPEDVDLFVLHTYANVLYYQKELAKLETVIHDKVQRAVDSVRKGGGEVLTDAQVCEAIQQEKRKLAVCFQQQCLKMKKEMECDMREQLKIQSQAFSDHLKEAIEARAAEIERDLSRVFDEKLENEKCRYKYQLATMIGRLRGLDHAIKAKADNDAMAKRAQVLWSAAQALLRSLRSTCAGQPWKDQLRPLNPEIKAIQKAAADNDELVCSVVAAIPKEATERGVYPEEAIRERFLKVEEVARKMALVPEEGASLPIHILSYLQSVLLVKAASPIPQSELEDCEVDFSKLDTNDILQRARYWLDRGDLEQTLKYMNLLKGAPRSVARQWMNETRILLETQQAANTLMAYAASSGLMYL
ncbi:unnamed protein product [Brassicogethes aeneus]|uniref:MICOS complex subunit MIC60 n=1 Tax=Brassicogethes aeneus TaxID=1431903 RepID=A0A9P0FJI9_BRAAE|nr:unnamed protein product [Brassicogethes aeneus]